jgi:NAD(P)-dependent dehydrogenase (short-subunit alcohol dehydrogenase family)
MLNCFDLSHRVAVVVGGTSGIGRAIVMGLAEQGADVVPTGRRANHIEEVCVAVEAMGRRTLRQVTDIRDRESVDALRETILHEFGRVVILVNAAGFTLKQPTIKLCDEQLSSILDTNLTGALRTCQSFYEALKGSGRGRIINIASLGSFVAFYEVAAYCASKTALLSLTRSLALEWAQDGISVNAIAPGIFPTEMTNGIVTGTARGQELLARTPMRRFGNPEELAGAAVLLASDAASFITGQCITVDGGFLASGVNS